MISYDKQYILLYKYVSLDSFEKTIQEWALKASLRHDVNDPLENIPRGEVGNVMSDTMNVPPFFSFSRKMSVTAIWGHYAENAKGVCMAFLFPVNAERTEEWGDTISQTDTEKTDTYLDLSTIEDKELKNKLQTSVFFPLDYNNSRAIGSDDSLDSYTAFRRILKRKAKCWEYENEIRLLCDISLADKSKNNMLLFSWPMRYFIGAITGPKCPIPPEVLKRQIEIAYNQHKNIGNYNIEKKVIPDWIVTAGRFAVESFLIESDFYKDGMSDYDFKHALEERT